MIDGIEVAFQVSLDRPGGGPTPQVGAKSRLTTAFWSEPMGTVSENTFIDGFENQLDSALHDFIFRRGHTQSTLPHHPHEFRDGSLSPIRIIPFMVNKWRSSVFVEVLIPI